jgi:hypothetical protein
VPTFTGAVGQSIPEFQQASAQYNDAMAKFFDDLQKKSELNTDCVGIKAPLCPAP